MTDFRELSDDELAQAADTGLRGSGAVIEMQRRLRDSNTRLTYVNFTLALAAVLLAGVQVWLAFYPPQTTRPAYSPMKSNPASKTPSDPLKLFSNDDQALHDCLVKANPKDPLGVFSETPSQAEQRKACIQEYGGH